jgi:hypothetical protein
MRMMQSGMNMRIAPVIVAVTSCAVAGCGGSTSPARPPIANALTLSGSEDTDVAGLATGSDPLGLPFFFRISAGPSSGSVQLEPQTGRFAYRGMPDFSGNDHFDFVIVAADGRISTAARVSVAIEPVNDAPRIAMIPAARNSAETLEVAIPFFAHDVEGDAIALSVAVADPAVATASVDHEARAIVVRPGSGGTTGITLRASDGMLEASETFKFEVGPVTKTRAFQHADPFGHAVQIANRSSMGIEFQLKHNGAVLATTHTELVDEALDSAVSATPERALWAYVNNATYHWYSLTPDRWVHDPVVLLNSIGFGLCDDVAAALVLMARNAGIGGNVWNLEGHVVAELGIGVPPGVYDADLSAYYFDDAGAVAGVASLTADTTLITSPRDAIYIDPTNVFAYSESIASIYGSTEDNTPANWNIETSTVEARPLVLVPGAFLQYPGVWVDAPATTGGEGFAAPVYSSLTLTLPAGWQGTTSLPLILKAIRGEGIVRIGATDFEIGSATLQLSLDNPTFWITDVEILSSTSAVELVFLLNPLRFAEASDVSVDVTGVDVWALEIQAVDLPESHRRSNQPTDDLRKPLF